MSEPAPRRAMPGGVTENSIMESEWLEIEGTWEEIAAQAPHFPGRRFRLIVLPEDPTAMGDPADHRSLEAKIAEITARVPDEEWAKLPADLGDHLDHHE